MVNPASPNRRPKRVPSKPNRVDLVPEEFDNLVEDQGLYTRITPSLVCPNRDEIASTNHVLDCPVCHGDEVVDLVDHSFKEWVFMQGIDFERNFDSQIWDIKDARVSVKTNTRIGYWYKIEVLDQASTYNQVMKRGDGDLDKTRYVPVISCDHDYYLLDANNVFYEKEVHYKTDGQNIRWIDTKRPGRGLVYSLIYPILPTFRVIEVIHDNRYYYISSKRKDKMPVNLPQQAVIRWDYLASRSGSNEPVNS